MLRCLAIACAVAIAPPAFAACEIGGCSAWSPPSVYKDCDPDAHGTCRAVAPRAGVILACARPYSGSVKAAHTMICHDGVCAYAVASDEDVPNVVKACRLDTWQDD